MGKTIGTRIDYKVNHILGTSINHFLVMNGAAIVIKCSASGTRVFTVRPPPPPNQPHYSWQTNPHTNKTTNSSNVNIIGGDADDDGNEKYIYFAIKARSQSFSI